MAAHAVLRQAEALERGAVVHEGSVAPAEHDDAAVAESCDDNRAQLADGRARRCGRKSNDRLRPVAAHLNRER